MEVRIMDYLNGNKTLSVLPLAHKIKDRVYRPIDTVGSFEVLHEGKI